MILYNYVIYTPNSNIIKSNCTRFKGEDAGVVVQLVWHRLLESSQLRKHPQVKDQIAILLQNLKKMNPYRNRKTRIMSQTKNSNQNDLQLQPLDQVADVEYEGVLDLKGRSK